jgi:uncharacterized protein (DUF1778 family)
MPGSRTKERQPRDISISLRADQRQRALIDRAADALGKNRSNFMLEAACREAEVVLLDRRFFLLDEKVYRRFITTLGKPPADNPRLRRLLASKATPAAPGLWGREANGR